MSETPAGFRTEPNTDVSTAKPAKTGPDFRGPDRQFGWMVINRWTRPVLLTLASKLAPKLDTTGVTITEVTAGAGTVQVVTPKACTGDGALLLIHGGGFVIGTNKDSLFLAVELAKQAGVPVFCPSYRLAPDHPFPAGLDDCHSGWTWLLDHASEHDVDPTKIVIGGVSAGGGHAASLAQRLHDEGGPQPAGQLLVYPMLDDRTAARRDLDKPRHRVWSNRNNLFGWSSYLGHAPGQPCAPYVSAARRDDLSGLPPAWIGVGGADLFLDEDRDYTERMRAAGVDVTYVEVDGGIHAFDAAQDSPLTKAFYASASEFVRRLTN